MTKAMGVSTTLQEFSIAPGASQLPPERTGFPVVAIAERDKYQLTEFCKAMPAGAVDNCPTERPGHHRPCGDDAAIRQWREAFEAFIRQPCQRAA